MTTKIYLRYEPWKDAVELVIFQEINGKRYIAKPLVFEEYEPGLIGEPTASFRSEDKVLEQIKQELNVMGLIDNADAATVKALNYHLEDMRSLVFKKAKP